ncbi:MAG TPA: hypothetical protein VI461_08600 [Chitinophagaceae bacterium]|nr:hypothetical protein [Chitinophagaceae bacterium]
MKQPYKIFLTALILGFITSCTIEKRSYMPGWHVEWKAGRYNITAKDSSATSKLENNQSAYNDKRFEQSLHSNTSSSDLPKTNNEPAILAAQQLPIEIIADKKDGGVKDIPDLRKTHPAAKASAITSALSGICFVILFFIFLAFLLGASFSNALLLTLFILGILLAILGVVLGVFGLYKIRKLPLVFKGKRLATYGLYAGLAVLLTILLIYLRILAFFA